MKVKAEYVTTLAKDAAYVSRYSGGNNAGHTVRVGEEEFKLHLIPSGIVREGVAVTVGNGVVVNPEVLEEEILALEDRGIEVRSRLKVDGRAHLIMPYHIGSTPTAKRRLARLRSVRPTVASARLMRIRLPGSASGSRTSSTWASSVPS